MTLFEAIPSRASCREFIPEPLAPVQRRQLGKTIDQCSRRSGLRFALVCDDPEPFSSFPKPQIKGARNYLLLAGPAGDPELEEKCGYYGEEVVLTAAAMGLGTCWVGGTYDRNSCLRQIREDEELVCVVAIGRPAPPQAPKRERTRKSFETLAPDCGDVPEWFSGGVAAVQYAPSAMNRQGYRFFLRKDGSVRVRLSGAGSFALVDLGIAKRHFELGAHGGEWAWGDGGAFRKSREEKSCGAVVWRQEAGQRQYLLVRHNGGHWSFPKGHVEDGETEAETAAREILEETGLTAEIQTDFRRQATYSPKPGTIKDVIFFTAVPTGGQERPQESEISQLGWFSFQDAAERITYATDEEILLAADAYLNHP